MTASVSNKKKVKSFSVTVSSSEAMDFIRGEYERVSDYTRVIYDTRDRFFTNYMTIAVALIGFLGYILQQETSTKSVSIHNNLPIFAGLALCILIVFGFGTLFLLTGNWLARDYYRQRRKRLQTLLLATPTDGEIQLALEDYLSFSRDKTHWIFRLTSIYAIYNSCISLANGIAVLLSFIINGKQFGLVSGIFTLAIVFLVHHAICYLYIKLYTKNMYPEG